MLEKKIRWQVLIYNMQFGFMPGKGTTDAIFIDHAISTREKPIK